MKIKNQLAEQITKAIKREYDDKLTSYYGALNEMRNHMLEQIATEENEVTIAIKYGHLSTIDTMMRLFTVTFDESVIYEKKASEEVQ